jgi:hypothetical protein
VFFTFGNKDALAGLHCFNKTHYDTAPPFWVLLEQSQKPSITETVSVLAFVSQME